MGAPNLTTGVLVDNPPSFMVTPDKRLLVLNGIQRPIYWNGMTASSDLAGVTGPTVAPTVAAAATGACSTGTYYCYYRYLDRDGFPSNLSPVATVSCTSGQRIEWSVLAASAETRVDRIQVFRSLVGDPDVVYLVATINNGTTTYSDTTLSDVLLADAVSLPILNPDDTIYANQFTPPPSHKGVAVMFGDRAFYGVDVHYTTGTVAVTATSTGIVGTGTSWNSAMVGRYFYKVGDTQSYLISAVGSTTSITLSTAYAGSTTSGSSYAISPPAGGRNVIYFSSRYDPTEANHIAGPEAVLSTNQHLIQDPAGDDDELTSLLTFGSNMFAGKRRHMYRVTYVRQPAIDMTSYIVLNRGCLNQRTWCAGGNGSTGYIMDEQGIYSFDGENALSISEPINDLFKNTSGTVIDWTNSKWFWAECWPTHNLVKFHVALSGDSGTRPMRAIVYNYQLKIWWMEQYPWELGGSIFSQISGRLRYIYAGESDLFYLTEVGTLDGLDSTTESGTVRGTVTSATSTTLTDSTATFPTAVATNLCSVCIVAGTGKGQRRRVSTRNSSTQITVSSAWTTTPDTTSVYQIGGIEWLVKFSMLRFSGGGSARQADRSIRVSFLPTTTAGSFDIRQYKDHESSPVNNQAAFVSGQGITYSLADPDGVKNTIHAISGPTTTYEPGYAYVPFDGGYEDVSVTRRWITPELRGFQGKDRITLYGVEVEGVGENGADG